MDNLTFGIPKKMKKTQEWNFMSDVAAIKISADRGHRKPKNIYLNQLAHDMLFSGVETGKKIGVNFDLPTKSIRFANVEGLGVEFSKVTKNAPYKFSDSKIYDYVISFLELGSSIDNFYILAKDSFDFPCGTLISVTEIGIDELSKDEPMIESIPESIVKVESVTEEVTEEQPTPEMLEDVTPGDW